MGKETVKGNKEKVNIKSYGLMEGIVLFIGLFVCIYVAFRKMNSDLFFILNNGKYICESGNLFPTTLFSTIHEGFYTVIQQPLWSVVTYLLFSAFGIGAIPVFSALFVFISAYLLFMLFKGADPFIRCCLTTFILIIICMAFTGRPSTFSITNILFSFFILEGIKEDTLPDRTALILLPFSLLELLCHASFFPILIFAKLSYLVASRFKDTIYKYRFLLMEVCLSLILGFMTPYREKLPLYSLYSYAAASYGNLIAELKRPSILSTYSIIIVIALALLAVQAAKGHADGVLLTVFGICSLLLHIRNLYLLGVFMVPMLKSLCCRRDESDQLSYGSRRFKMRFFIPLAFVIFYIAYAQDIYMNYAIKDCCLSPVIACDYLKDEKDVKIYSDFNMGAFLEFNGFNSYIDARPELYSKRINGKEDIYNEFIELSLLDNFDYNGFINKYGFEYLLTEDGSKLSFYLNYRKGYEKILTGNGYSLYRVSDYES